MDCSLAPAEPSFLGRGGEGFTQGVHPNGLLFKSQFGEQHFSGLPAGLSLGTTLRYQIKWAWPGKFKSSKSHFLDHLPQAAQQRENFKPYCCWSPPPPWFLRNPSERPRQQKEGCTVAQSRAQGSVARV